MLFKVKNLISPKSIILDVTFEFIKALGVPVTKQALKREIEEHPDQQSLLSVSDVLTTYRVENVVAAVDGDNLFQIQTPFITQLQWPGYGTSFTMVSAINSDNVTYFNALTSTWQHSRTEAFVTNYNGTVLIAAAGEGSGDKDYIETRRRENQRQLIQTLSIAAIPLLVTVMGGIILANAGTAALGPLILLLICLTGCVATVLLLWYEVDSQNPALKQICGAAAKTNCLAVTGSKASGIAGVSWSIIGFSYFFGSLLVLLIGGPLNSQLLFILSGLNLLAMPYIIFSIYYQWRVVRQWCLLCLAVQALLALQCITGQIAGWLYNAHPGQITAEIIIGVITAFAAPFILANLLMPALHKIKEGKRLKKEFTALKHNPQIFNSLLHAQKAIPRPSPGLGLILGNANAPNKIIKVCNPYCAPCADAHPTIEALLESNPDLQVQIIFTSSNDEGDIGAPPVRHLMAIAEKNDEELLKTALDDWYNSPVKDYERFAGKHKLNGELKLQGEKLAAMRAWCQDTQIGFTPTFFVNGYQLPQIYTVKDLKYFLSN